MRSGWITSTNLYQENSPPHFINSLERGKKNLFEGLLLQLFYCATLFNSYLSGNAITVVEGLESAKDLKELHIAHQRMPEGEKLLFEPRSLQAVAVSYINCVCEGCEFVCGEGQ